MPAAAGLGYLRINIELLLNRKKSLMQGSALTHSSPRAIRLQFCLRLIVGVAAIWAILYQAASMGALLGYGSILPAWFDDALIRDWAGWTAQFLASAAAILALISAMGVVRGLIRVEAFSERVGAKLRQFSLWLTIAIACRVIVPPLFVCAGRLIGTRVPASVEISANDILLLVAGAVLFEISRLLDDASRLADEYRQIV